MKGKKAIRNISFKLEQRKDKKTNEVKKDHVPILCDFKINDDRVKYPIGYRIDAGKWNEAAQQVKINNFNKDGVSYAVINRRIQDITKQLPEIYYEFESYGINATPKSVWQELTNRIHEADGLNRKKAPKEKNIQDYLKQFIDELSSDKSPNTIKTFVTFSKHIKQFAPDCTFNDINRDFLRKYIDFQTNVLTLNTRSNAKYMRVFKWFLNWATKAEYNNNLDYQKFEYSLKGTEPEATRQNIVFLSWNELMMLYSLDLSENKRLEQVRDVYCFCCFTGLRYSDLANLKKSDFKTDDNGGVFIKFTTIKTDDSLSISLNKYALSLAEKYKDIPMIGNKAFPTLSNQKFNDYLKELGQVAELNSIETFIEYRGTERIEKTFHKWELLTSHTARKTFVTNALAMGIQPDVIRKWTGHKDHKTMETYIKIVEAQKQTAMNKFNER